ncbi:MAG: hypothetical protein ACSW8D_01045 [Prevotella sp.]
MADVITRFKLETTQYDSKLRDAAKGLKEYARQASFAGNEFGKFTQKNVEAARALGNIAPSATNAKDKVKELVGAFNDVANAYNALTKEQQQSDFGKAMAASLNQLSQRIREAKQELYGLGDATKDVKAGGGLFSGLGDKMSGAFQVFAGNMLTKAAGAVANLGSEMVDMVKQGVEMAKAGEGIRIAFERLGRGDILDGLREATHGTVTDLELMKAAVKFNDFKLPVEELGTMLAFAQQKAKDTGQSVDYMVDSIVTGLGRKSLMILDNLGLSANEVKEKMAETGDMTKAVGAIIREQMAKAGDYVETAADRAAQANVSLQNKMEELGRKFGPVEEASNQLWTSMKIGILDIIGGPLATMLNQLTEAGRLKNALNNLNGDDGSGNTKVGQQLSALRGSNYKNAKYKRQLAQYDKQIDTYQRMIDNGGKLPGAPAGSGKDVRWLQSQMDALKSMRSEYVQGAKEIMKPVETNIKTDKSEQNIKTLTAQLKELEKQRKDAIAAGDTDLSKNLTKQINQVKADINGLGGTTTNTKIGKTEVESVIGSIDYQTKKVQDLQKAWRAAADDDSRQKIKAEIEEQQYLLDRMTGKEKFDPAKMGPIADLTGRVPMPDFGVDMKRGKDGKWYDATAPVAPDELKFSDSLQKFMDYMEKQQVDDYKKRKSRDGLDDTKKVVSGLGQVASGLQQMGIKLPEEVQQIIGVVNGLMTVIDGVNTIIGVTQSANLTANTIALGVLTQAIYTNTAFSLIPGMAHGGLVHAATGYMVPGNDHADRTLIAASSGELILNRAQQGVIASQLESGNGGGMRVVGEIQGEKIVLVANRFLKRSGQGELVTWK